MMQTHSDGSELKSLETDDSFLNVTAFNFNPSLGLPKTAYPLN